MNCWCCSAPCKKHFPGNSLYEPIGTDKEGNEISLLDVMEGPAVDVVEEYSPEKISVMYWIHEVSVLNSKEYEVIRCRFGLFGQKEQTRKSPGTFTSAASVSRIGKRLQKLRTLFFSKTEKYALRVLPL